MKTKPIDEFNIGGGVQRSSPPEPAPVEVEDEDAEDTNTAPGHV